MEEDGDHNSTLERSDSSDSTGSVKIDTLVKIAKALHVEENHTTKPQAKELIQMLIEDYNEYDTIFLKEYLVVLQNGNPSAVKEVTNDIVLSIEEVLQQQLGSNRQWQEPVLVLLLGWMCVTVLCLMDPQVQSPYRAINELLLHTTMKERVRLASAFWRNLNPAQLIELADVTTGPKPLTRLEDPAEHEAPLADLLLRAALCRLQPERPEPQWQSGPLRVEEVAAGFRSSWAAADADARPLLAKLAARTRSVPALLAVSEAVPADERPDTLKVLIEMSKLRLLFLDDEKKSEPSAKKTNKRRKKEQ